MVAIDRRFCLVGVSLWRASLRQHLRIAVLPSEGTQGTHWHFERANETESQTIADGSTNPELGERNWVEPTGALGVAALMEPESFRRKRVCCIISGSECGWGIEGYWGERVVLKGQYLQSKIV